MNSYCSLVKFKMSESKGESKGEEATGGEYGIQGKHHGEKGKEHGIEGQQFGIQGKDAGSLGGVNGQEGGEHGHKGKESGQTGEYHGWTSTKFQKENNLGGYWFHKKHSTTPVSTSSKKNKGDVKSQKRRAKERRKLAKKMKIAAMSGNTSFRCKYF